ncbi:hypothetical protein K461DRAFT_296576 [Myriangium duriaei CBS 260.36]|uniref:Zn(2)-C6 fungal-type domain-containing protein n=1 Tax=Myriangium duriaei CBS 260.36 TaxID=1168546 RepID=A0A9P4IX63_9PEZI|nr:hypothetical protein K461DRAFT_296576 [Myriangium duriaei CBS 260.36]
MDEKPRLTCEQCRQRKRKCDKGVPCSSCKAAGLRCEAVQRARLPRGRTGRAKEKNKKLEERVARIESLLSQARSKPEHDYDLPPSDQQNGEAAQSPAAQFDGLIAPDFWTALSQEVTSLKGTIVGTDDELHDEDEALDMKPDEVSITSDGLLFTSSTSTRTTVDAARTLAAQLPHHLYPIFRDRVDNVFKMLHWPSTMRNIQEQKGKPTTTESLHVLLLDLSIQFMALCAMNDQECRQLLGTSHSNLVARYKTAVQDILAMVDLLVAPKVLTLQAFVLYLLGIRACGMYTTHWAYVALLVRIAADFRFGAERPNAYSPLDLEIRRRLWYSICLIDTQAALDRGTTPIIRRSALGPLPQDVDDDVLSGSSNGANTNNCYTEMTVSMISYESMTCHLRICDAVRDGADTSWEYKIRTVAEFEETMHRKYIANKEPRTPYDYMAMATAKGIISNMQLLLRRPPYRQPNAVPASDKFDVVEAATKTMEKHINMEQPLLERWGWKIWPPWYALAVVLAEMCKPDAQGLNERHWTVALAAFHRYARPSDDPESGLLWKPITKLLRRVRRQRRAPMKDGGDEQIDGPSEKLSTSTFTPPELSEPLDLLDPNTMDWDPSINNVNGSILDDPEFLGLYEQLDPTSGISWLDWDSILGDDEITFKV